MTEDDNHKPKHTFTEEETLLIINLGEKYSNIDLKIWTHQLKHKFQGRKVITEGLCILVHQLWKDTMCFIISKRKNKNLIIFYTSYSFRPNSNKTITTLKVNTPHMKVE